MADESKTAADAATASPPVRIICGTMTFAMQCDKDASTAQLKGFVAGNATETRPRYELDTARMYARGYTENMLGDIFRENPELKKNFIVATKANPFKGFNENLRPDNVVDQLEKSLEAMGLTSCDIFYLHAPDLDTPIERTLEACQKLYEAGKFRELGLSNYPAWEVVHIWHICDRNGWVKPTLYQGMYNAVTRQVEMELFPALRKLGIRFYAYNPLAGGLITGRYRKGDNPESGRFGGFTKTMYRARYFKGQFFDGVELVRAACEAAGITMAAASIKWLAHHSQLSGGLNDGIIIGASSQAHLDDNVANIVSQEKLPAEVVEAFDKAWELCKPVCPKYFRP